MEVNLRGATTPTPFVTNIDYDAKGQRVLIEYGNDVRTTYEYDPVTFRLIHLHTTRRAESHGLASPTAQIHRRGVQDLAMLTIRPATLRSFATTLCRRSFSTTSRWSRRTATTPTMPFIVSSPRRDASTSARSSHHTPPWNDRDSESGSAAIPMTSRRCATTPSSTITTRSETSGNDPHASERQLDARLHLRRAESHRTGKGQQPPEQHHCRRHNRQVPLRRPRQHDCHAAPRERWLGISRTSSSRRTWAAEARRSTFTTHPGPAREKGH